VERLLDEMAPIKKLTQKEQGLKNRPWITSGILTSMRARDKLYKEFALEKDPNKKNEISVNYKRYRNEVVNKIESID
jgi:hypothetical protein